VGSAEVPGSFRKLLVGSIGALSLVGLGSVSVGAHSDTLVEFDSMTPVTGAAVGTVNDRGITGGGLAWVIRSGRGEVDASGDVDVRVKGLVIPAAPLNGTNPVPFFGATVSCLTPGGTVNVSTGLFPASSEGDAKIDGHVNLPATCNDPEVFVVSPGGAWFAMSNGEE
jgi:hypothetical protein